MARLTITDHDGDALYVEDGCSERSDASLFIAMQQDNGIYLFRSGALALRDHLNEFLGDEDRVDGNVVSRS
jgi:hypothetical protein